VQIAQRLGSCSLALVFLLASLNPFFPAFGSDELPGASVAITVYNEGFAVVRQKLPLNLTPGVNHVQITDITARLEPDSVILRPLEADQHLYILEQNYRNDPITQSLLLSLNEVQRQVEKLAYGVDKANVPDAIARLKSGEFSLIHVDMIARADAIEAIPSLKQQFVRVDDPLLKAKIAAALVRMGDKDDTYWNFLVEFAEPALQSDEPDYNGYDQQGKAVPGPSPEFQAWAKAHNVSVESELDDSVRVGSTGVISLGWSRDLRAIPLLRKALLSPNHMIEIFAALGLARDRRQRIDSPHYQRTRTGSSRGGGHNRRVLSLFRRQFSTKRSRSVHPEERR
jgi:hypothetical protein